jgi:hypothetical protein
MKFNCNLLYLNKPWKIRNNLEIDKLIEGADIVGFIEAQIIKWLEHIK